MVLSEKLKILIRSIVSTPEFWKINYYLRSMKKAPHGGIFYVEYPNMFLKYYTVPSYLFFTPNAEIPASVLDIADKFQAMIDASNIDTEELLRYCLGIDPDDCGNPHNGSRMYIATYGKIITSAERSEMEHMAAVSDAIEGKISYSGNFNIDEERLILLFIFTLMEYFTHRIHDVNEIVSYEKLTLPTDKYGLSDVTDAEFKRQGFKLNDKYYLYNIFLDTSIGSPVSDAPKTIKIIRSNPLICFGINPSTAEPENLNPTVNYASSVATSNGYDCFVMLNVYPQRATDPKSQHKAFLPELKTENERHIAALVSGRELTLLAAWGGLIKKRQLDSSIWRS